MTTIKNILKAVVPSSLWLAMRRRYVKAVGQRFVAYTVTRQFHRGTVTFTIADPLAERWYGKGREIIEEVAFLESGKLKTGARVFDIGAHQGIVAIVMAKLVGTSGQVVAVEANPYHARCAAANARLNAVPQLQVIHAAIASEPGELTFSSDWDGQSFNRRGVKVPAETIDTLAARYGQPDVLFLDVEGFECEALKGAIEVLKRRPDFYIEVHAGVGLEASGGSVETLLRLLPSDYSLTAMPEGGVPVPFRRDLPWLDRRFFLFGVTAQTSGGDAGGPMA